MATKITVDPLAGLPTATAKPAVSKTPSVPVPGVINLKAAKAKRSKLSGQAYKDARDFARGATGYNDTSPIWGKRMPAVLMEIEQNLADAIDTGSMLGAAASFVENALLQNRELQKRLATNQLISAQS